MDPINVVGWLLVVFLGVSILYLALKTTSSVQIEKDGVRTSGVMRWSDQQHFLFADIRRFEERYWKPPLSRYGQGEWRLYVVTVEDGREVRSELPMDSTASFSMLKAALAEWQTAHGCLQPLPLADLSERVRY